MTAEKVAHVDLYPLPKKYRHDAHKVAYKCMHSAINGAPGLYLCRSCKAAVDGGAELRILSAKKYKRKIVIQIYKKYGVPGGWYGKIWGTIGPDIEIGECRSRNALLERAKKLIEAREREPSTV